MFRVRFRHLIHLVSHSGIQPTIRLNNTHVFWIWAVAGICFAISRLAIAIGWCVCSVRRCCTWRGWRRSRRHWWCWRRCSRCCTTFWRHLFSSGKTTLSQIVVGSTKLHLSASLLLDTTLSILATTFFYDRWLEIFSHSGHVSGCSIVDWFIPPWLWSPAGYRVVRANAKKEKENI